MMSVETIFKFACPECDAEPGSHGRYGCDCPEPDGSCPGVICECEESDVPECNDPDHGMTMANSCTNAVCYHCGWCGFLPVRPLPWQRKALAAGWTPPAGWEAGK